MEVRSLEMVSPKSFALSTTLMFTPSMTSGGKSLSTLANEMLSSLQCLTHCYTFKLADFLNVWAQYLFNLKTGSRRYNG